MSIVIKLNNTFVKRLYRATISLYIQLKREKLKKSILKIIIISFINISFYAAISVDVKFIHSKKD